ncbi:oxidative phosphorylation uncoupler [Mactra antiquata]
MTSSSSQPYRRHAVPEEYSLCNKLFSAGIAACMADLITFPLDTAKVRLQIRNSSKSSITETMKLLINGDYIRQSSYPSKSPGMFGTLSSICRNEGPKSMYSGLSAGLQRQMCFSSIRLGFYDDVKAHYQKIFAADSKSSPSVFIRLLSGLTTGVMCVTVAQPTDVVKIRMQAAGAQPGPKLYTGVFKAYANIYNKEGLRGLWKGYFPNVTRNSITNMSEIVSYDMIKEYILHHGHMTDNFPCHVVCGFSAGFVATVIASPVDVIKTRYMSANPGQYNGVIDCAKQIVSENGFRGLYKGFVPSFIRFGSWNILMFVFYEQLKRKVSEMSHPDHVPILIPEKLAQYTPLCTKPEVK